eukprot:UN12034
MDGSKIHRGICNHLCDIFVTELYKVVSGNERITFITFFDYWNLLSKYRVNVKINFMQNDVNVKYLMKDFGKYR